MFRIATAAAVLGLAFGGSAFAQQQEGLVTVNVSDIEALNANTVQIPIGIAAQVCPDLDVNVLTDAQRGGDEVVCTVQQENATEALTNFVQRGGGNNNAGGNGQGKGQGNNASGG